jgi:hypothetical protein
MSWMTKDSRFDSWQGEEFFLPSTAFKLALGPTQPLLIGYLVLYPWGKSGWSTKLVIINFFLVLRLSINGNIPSVHNTSP